MIEHPVSEWYVYVVMCNDDTLYTGITTDIERRVEEHNSGNRGAKYTRSRRPVTLVYHVAHPDRSTASKEEFKFKKLSRKKKIDIIYNKR